MNDEVLFLQLKKILLLQNCDEYDIKEIERAFSFASELHAGQYRLSEEPYIVHPLEVAKILASLQVDKNTVIAALLHDIIEDTQATDEDVKEKFGIDVYNLVSGVTKLSKYQFKSKEERQAENFRRMFIAMANDIRVIFLKLADRLHNMRTLNYMAPPKQKKIAQETLDIFAPLANRLGIGFIKTELEDLSLRYLYPEKYFEIAQLVSEKKAERESTVNMLIEKISACLRTQNIKAQIQGRAKHYYSIYSKMERLNIAFHDLYDITAVRVIVDSEKECYEVLGVIHSQFKPIPGRFKDYIAMPKANMYRSLHTSVLGPHSKPLEVQIRTKEMHEVAEYGVAAHWRYKESGVQSANSEIDKQFSWMRKMAEMDKDVSTASEYVETVKIELFANQVFAFTPMGDVIDLPAGATPVDFAFKIHTDVGYKTTGALINGRIAQLDTKLNNGDIVEILTSKSSAPKLDWLNFVVSKTAQNRIRLWFKKHNREDHIAIGRQNLETELTKAVFEDLLKNGELLKIAKSLNYSGIDDLFSAIGYGETTVQKVINKFKKTSSEGEEPPIFAMHRKNVKKNDIIGLEGMLYNFAKCCSPVPGEPIVGVVTRSKGVSVHRIDCKCLDEIPAERLLNIKWADANLNKTYVTSIKLAVNDRVGMLREILNCIADTNTNIICANVKSLNTKKIGVVELSIEVSNITTLRNVIQILQSLPDVYSVKRIPSQRNFNSLQGGKTKKNKPKNKTT